MQMAKGTGGEAVKLSTEGVRFEPKHEGSKGTPLQASQTELPVDEMLEIKMPPKEAVLALASKKSAA